MYNTPDKHSSPVPRSKFDFSDIDNLDRATESFMKQQRKSLGYSRFNLDAIAEQGKRILVFVVLGAIFVTALVAGVRFSYNDDEMRAPEQSVSDDVSGSETNQTTNGSSTDLPKDEANGSAATSSTAVQTESSVTTLPTTLSEEQNIATTLPQLTESSESSVITTPVLAATTTSKARTTTTTKQTTTTKKTTTTKATTTSITTKKTTTTSRTTTTTTTTTTTKRTTTTLTTTTSTTTTTTTTTPKPLLEIVAPRITSSEVMSNGTYRSEITVSVYNDSSVSASDFTISITCATNGVCTTALTQQANWEVDYGGTNITATYDGKLGSYQYVTLRLIVVTTTQLTGCSATV